jgi:hypothetical protein
MNSARKDKLATDSAPRDRKRAGNLVRADAKGLEQHFSFEVKIASQEKS